MEKFISLMAEALEKDVSQMQGGDDFRSYDEWDSLAVLALMAMINENYDITISRADFEQIQSVEGIYKKIIEEAGA